MLVLGRRRGETVRIGRDITVTVLGVSGGRVRLGLTAPALVGIVRQEPDDRPTGPPRGKGKNNVPVRPILEEDLDVREGTELPARRPPEAGASRPAGA
jgi:carbon storage regulator CsrA